MAINLPPEIDEAAVHPVKVLAGCAKPVREFVVNVRASGYGRSRVARLLRLQRVQAAFCRPDQNNPSAPVLLVRLSTGRKELLENVLAKYALLAGGGVLVKRARVIEAVCPAYWATVL